MFWLFVIFSVGLSYLYYRYTAVANKKIFFRSSLFLSLIGSITLLALSIGIVNVVNVRSADEPSALASDSLQLATMDTTASTLVSKGPAYSYRTLTTLHRLLQYSHLVALRHTYAQFSESESENVSSLGYFGLGILALQDNDAGLARNHLMAVKNKSLPYLHFCLAESLMRENKKIDAASEYEKELQIDSGNRIDAFAALVQLHEEGKQYDKLQSLLNSDLADSHFPEPLARSTLLRMHDYGAYAVWIFKIFTHRLHVVGFIAAFLISAMWLIYLSYLDVFKPERALWLIIMFAGGMIFCPGVFLIDDIVSLNSSWTLNDEFLNDLFYCIMMIGLPEEFVKMIPLLGLALFSKKVNEPIDYLIYGSASALGFAFMENLLYFAEIKNGIIHGRAYLSVIGHMTFTSIVAYAFVVSKYKIKETRTLWHKLPAAFAIAATVHGLYDVLLFHNLIFFFFIFFILIVQFWIMMINNAMNNSLHFNYRTATRAEGSRFAITLSLTAVFALEYVYAGLSKGASVGNGQLLSNAGFAGFLIIFFSSNLASFDLIQGYWRSMSLFSKEKRGYGNRQQLGPWINWYFVNASRAHNYVGVYVRIYNEKYNHVLADYFDGEYEGRIVHRMVLYEDDIPDPHWFLVRMRTPVPLPNDREDYVLVKLRYQEDSLLYEDDVEVFFKGIPDISMLRRERPLKTDFPFYGWAVMKSEMGEKAVETSGVSR